MAGAPVRGDGDSTEAGEGRWLTYDELAAVRGIKRIGAVRLAQRMKWRRTAGNDGKARVLVPAASLALVRGTKPGGEAGALVPHHGAPDGAGTIVAAFE